MKICPKCYTENEEDAIYCKKCASLLNEDKNSNKDKEKKHVKKDKTVKKKVKTKYKTKVVKEKGSSEKQKSSFFSKFLVFILLIIVIALAGIASVFAYHYYQENNIEVPSVIGYSYEEATAILDEAKLSYQQKEELTTDESEVGVVIKQSKRAGSKAHENAVITLTVGVLDSRVEVPDVRGMMLEDAINTLNHAGISYQLVYKESNKDENVILKQSIRPGKEIDNSESVTLTVSVSKKEDDTNENKEDNESVSDNIENEESSDNNLVQ